MTSAEKVNAWMDQAHLSLMARVWNTFGVGGAGLALGVIAGCALGSYWWALAGLGWLFLCYAHVFGVLVSLERMRLDDATARAWAALTEEKPKA